MKAAATGDSARRPGLRPSSLNEQKYPSLREERERLGHPPAKRFEFEKAAKLRDTIKELRTKEFLFA